MVTTAALARVPVSGLVLPPERVVQVDGLTVRFATSERTVEAVRNLSFHVDRGETLAVVGESGSGKSVTSLALMRLVEHGGGKIASGSMALRRRGGEVIDLARTDNATLRSVRGADVAMIFQEPMTSLNPVFPVGEQIAESIRLHQGKSRAAARAEALRMLELVRIPEARRVLERYPHQLSGGMRQRVMIAMALSCKPALLIADEPTTALDVTIQAEILQLIRGLQAEMQMGVVFITHDMGVVAEVADRVLVMYRGEKVEEGTSDDVFRAPAHPYTRALLSAVPRLGAMQGTDLPAKFPLLRLDSASPEQAAPQDTVRPGVAPILRVQDLVTRFDVPGGLFGRVTRRVHAVEQVSFDLYPGETLALVGESGCGKSTTGRSLLRLVESQSGTIEFNGQNISKLEGPALQTLRRNIQFIFQDPFASLDPRVPVGYSIMEPLLVHKVASGKEAEQRVAWLLDKVGLDPSHAARYPHEFSGGQRQRICIARALALNPKVVVADESVSALDVSIQAQIVNLMLDLQRELGIAFLFISHDMAVVERVSHRVAVMYLGQIVEIGPRRAIFENPQHPYTKKLMAAVPIADPARRHLRREPLNDEIPSPIRAVGDEPVVQPLVPVAGSGSLGHYVARHAVGGAY
ncbi:putative oligopeptide ABC transporter, fused atp_binding components [Cupriavidus taiwanensis]|uniref:Glutathione import ATP-binding protein GsiA n=1 Tax=Cupriavidus taiwanensis TaxID=164546 RepID=A0A375E239_9BURK|nr:dipeptide ABC transporter ATP-binding protein [Cupriavidus taiwanensis]SOZ52391.1 putative oligopeptide ABC transporter, fused atp_binding components [Cupriavidus taiwanensis]SOZ53861.1 putative oligopeptide ABC transporter, fused atp_binding components [Cupriavidus taiwanensis]SOZ56384.1 putative oligopeptide ABC transporter, fused atp_binding components [Cupriavidus taiwanensis]SOZ97784.1 putative oligopeptide ABC transporter, fused atp_binding components [Cupriavidus taiwanensis]SPA04676